nr:heavy metal sensor histidine kinase [Paracandidimonas lactea]
MLRVPSMYQRLIIVFGSIALVGSCLAGLVLFKVISYEVRHQEITEIRGKVEVITHLASIQDNPIDVDVFKKSLATLLGEHEYLEAWIFDPQGALIYGKPFPADQYDVPEGGFTIDLPDGRRLRGLDANITVGEVPNYSLIVAVDTARGDKLLYVFGTTLFAVCLAWVAFVSALATWAVRRSLSSIDQLSEQAARIGPQDAHVRLPVESIDIELRQLSTTFNRALDRVQDAYRRSEGFNADVAHELRTPLANLISGTEVILGRARSAEELRATMMSNLEELELLQLMVNDMLFLARADSGAVAAELVPISMRSEVVIVLDYYEAMLDSAELRVNVVGDADASANARLIRRAISNLVSNAIKATPPGEVISIEIHSDVERAHIKVRNSGTGIPEEVLPKIFERFFRADLSRTQRPQGHGLGLSIVSAIARMHGGGTFARSGKDWSEVGFYIARKAESG